MSDKIREVFDRVEARQPKPLQVSELPDHLPLDEIAELVVRGKVRLAPEQQRMLIELLPYLKPKLTAVALTAMSGADFAARLDRAIARSASGKPIKLIEAQAVEVGDER